MFPLLQRHGAVRIVIDFRHHVLQDLNTENNTSVMRAAHWEQRFSLRKHTGFPERVLSKYWASTAWVLSTHRFEFRDVPAQVLGDVHHLTDDALHLLVVQVAVPVRVIQPEHNYKARQYTGLVFLPSWVCVCVSLCAGVCVSQPEHNYKAWQVTGLVFLPSWVCVCVQVCVLHSWNTTTRHGNTQG